MVAAKISPAQTKDLMRHSDIERAMNVYGRTLTAAMRAANAVVAGQLLLGGVLWIILHSSAIHAINRLHRSKAAPV